MLSIIIVNYKNPPLLRLCLQSLARNISSDFSHEIIVVDSQSTAETRMVVTEEFAQRFAHILVLPFKENTGYTRGVNEGLRVASGEHLLILNPDIILTPNALSNMLDAMKANPHVGLLGPQLLNFDDTIQQSCFRFYSPLTILYRRISHLPFSEKILNRFLMRDQNLLHQIPVDWLMGSALMTTRSALTRIGFMDEQFFLYMSEVDWARRFWDNGYTVLYYPGASLYHYHQRQSKGGLGILDVFSRQETRWHIIDAFRYFYKWGMSSLRKP